LTFYLYGYAFFGAGMGIMAVGPALMPVLRAGAARFEDGVFLFEAHELYGDGLGGLAASAGSTHGSAFLSGNMNIG
jgi:hypothetical protein